MSKHPNYGKTFGLFYEAYRKFCRENAAAGTLQEDSLMQFYEFYLKNFTYSLDDATCMQLFIRDVKREIVHIYMRDNQLLDFLKNVEVKDLTGIKQYIKNNGEKVIVNEDDFLENTTNGVNLAFCLHIPYMSQGYVFGLTMYENDELRIFVNHGMNQYHISSLDIENKKSLVYTDSEIHDIAMLTINLISYINCFPECLQDGAPRDVKTERNHYLETSDKVIESMINDTKGVVIPHFRRGYFKLLSSDYYKNKKGQIIFVHETVVNAQAKTLTNKN